MLVQPCQPITDKLTKKIFKPILIIHICYDDYNLNHIYKALEKAMGYS